MTPKSRLLFRLLAPPGLAAVITVLLSALSLLELAGNGRKRRGEGEEARPLVEVERKGLVPISSGVPDLSEDEALLRLMRRPDRAAVARLWPIGKHRETLFKVVLSESTPDDVRLFLLNALERETPKMALQAARAMACEKDLLEGPLLLSALEILARRGEKSDLALLAERPGESHQLRTLREEYRDTIQRRSK